MSFPATGVPTPSRTYAPGVTVAHVQVPMRQNDYFWCVFHQSVTARQRRLYMLLLLLATAHKSCPLRQSTATATALPRLHHACTQPYKRQQAISAHAARCARRWSWCLAVAWARSLMKCRTPLSSSTLTFPTSTPQASRDIQDVLFWARLRAFQLSCCRRVLALILIVLQMPFSLAAHVCLHVCARQHRCACGFIHP